MSATWWFFRRKFGLFGFLFWLYTVQWLLILITGQLTIWMTGPDPVTVAGPLQMPAAVAWLFIGVIPFVLEPIAVLTALAVLASRRLGTRAKAEAKGVER